MQDVEMSVAECRISIPFRDMCVCVSYFLYLIDDDAQSGPFFVCLSGNDK